jgi:effector-binding domain-containing protein
MGPAIGEVMGAIAAQGVAPAGPVFSHHFRMDPDVFDFEVGVPVTRPVADTGRVRVSELPAATVARTVYQGPYEGLGAAWGEFGTWIASEGHEPAADLWECYVAGPESSPDPATWRTELNRPLTR